MKPETKRAILKACKWVFWGVTGPILAFFLFAFVVFSFVGMENYCWWWPLVDTEFTPDYSDEKFARIQPGMTREEVTVILGKPRDILGGIWLEDPKDILDEVWVYSNDGAAQKRLGRDADFAWLFVGVIFDPKTGRVTKTTKVWLYD